MSGSVFHDAAWMAEQIGMSVDWVRHNTQKLPHHRVGTKVRFTEHSVAEFIETTKVSPAAPAERSASQTATPDARSVLTAVPFPQPTSRSQAAHRRQAVK